jgi:hypothetical protein
MASCEGVLPVLSATASTSSAPPCAAAVQKPWCGLVQQTGEKRAWRAMTQMLTKHPKLRNAAKQGPDVCKRGDSDAATAGQQGGGRTWSSTVQASVCPRIAAQCSGVQPSLSGRLQREPRTSSRRSVSVERKGREAHGGP